MKGICKLCHQYRWLGGKGRVCKPCGYPIGQCRCCRKKRKIYVDRLCYICYENRQVRKKLLSVEKSFVPISDYNQHLFDLYLTYIRRYDLKYHHLRQTNQVKSLLEKRSLPAFKSWMDIYDYATCYPLTHKPHSQKGNAILKIGYMLQELGVLAPKEEELGRQLKNLLAAFTAKEQKWIAPFLENLEKTKRAPATLAEYLLVLRNLNTWLKSTYPDATLLTVNHQLLQKYLLYLSASQAKPKFIQDAFDSLNKFYRWCKFKKLILVNPCQNIKLNRQRPRLYICSEEHTRKLFAFVKSPASDPEQALLICLVLFFALTTEELAFATLDAQNDQLCVMFRRKLKSYRRRFYNREQLLRLPTSPAWFLQLQKRFYESWSSQYQQTQKTYPHKLLLLPHHYHYNRPLSTTTVRERIKKATIAATGIYIPVRVLRPTCGDLHTNGHDASLLTRLGWSPQFAFHYTWMPRTYFSAQQNQK